MVWVKRRCDPIEGTGRLWKEYCVRWNVVWPPAPLFPPETRALDQRFYCPEQYYCQNAMIVPEPTDRQPVPRPILYIVCKLRPKGMKADRYYQEKERDFRSDRLDDPSKRGAAGGSSSSQSMPSTPARGNGKSQSGTRRWWGWGKSRTAANSEISIDVLTDLEDVEVYASLWAVDDTTKTITALVAPTQDWYAEFGSGSTKQELCRSRVATPGAAVQKTFTDESLLGLDNSLQCESETKVSFKIGDSVTFYLPDLKVLASIVILVYSFWSPVDSLLSSPGPRALP